MYRLPSIFNDPPTKISAGKCFRSFPSLQDSIHPGRKKQLAPEKWCLEYYSPFGARPIFRGRTVKLQEGKITSVFGFGSPWEILHRWSRKSRQSHWPRWHGSLQWGRPACDWKPETAGKTRPDTGASFADIGFRTSAYLTPLPQTPVPPKTEKKSATSWKQAVFEWKSSKDTAKISAVIGLKGLKLE